MIAWDNGLLLDPDLQVHHRNENRSDNRLANLAVMDIGDHALLHVEKRGVVINQYGTWPVKPEALRESQIIRHAPKLCARCGAEMRLRADAIYCSPRCRVASFKARRLR